MSRVIAWTLASMLVAGVASAQPPNRSRELYGRAGHVATASTISFAVAGVAIVAAAVVWLTDPRAARRFGSVGPLTWGM
jgi:hypothetical protein